MQRIFFSKRSLLSQLTILTGVVFVLQSCCCIPQGGSASKYCDCGKKNVASNDTKKEITVKNDAKIAVTKSEKPPVTTNPLPVDISPAMMIKATDKKAAGFFKVKKLPLGIKAMNTQVVAGPSLCFKSSKEDYGGVDAKHKAGAGFQLGVKSTFTFSEKLDISTGLLLKKNTASEVLSYSSPGEPGGGGYNEEFESTYSYTYLSAPIMAEIKLSDQFTIMAGPEVNLLTGAHVKAEGYGGDEDKTDIKDNSVKVGAGIQAGIKYSIPNSPLAVQVIYDHRISRLNEKTTSDYYGGGGTEVPAWNMKSIQLGLTCSICELLKKN